MKKFSELCKKHIILLTAVLGVIIPLIITNTYLVHVIFMCVMFGVLSSSLNISVGLTGLSNFAHATFFSIGAYAAAILSSRFNCPFYITLIAGGIIAGVFGIILGAPTLRLKGVFLALVTTGFGQVTRIIQINWVDLTNGPMGITGIPPAILGGWKFSRIAYIYYGLVLLLMCMYVTNCIFRSKIGRALFAIKYDDTVARSLGINTTFYKVGAYVLSASLAGMAGTVFAHYSSFISPDSVTMADSITVLSMVILGGAGTLLGPILGAIVLTITPELFRFAQLYRIMFIGIVMVLGIIANEHNWKGIISDKMRNVFRKAEPVKSRGELS